LSRLRRMARLMILSVQNWLNTHNSVHYGDEAPILARQMHDLLAYADAIFDDEKETILERNPFSRGQQEWILLAKSWMVGKRLIFSATGSRLVTVMFLYRHLRAHADMPQIDVLEYLRKFVFPGPLGKLCYRLDIPHPSPLPDRDSLTSALEWAEEYESALEQWALDAFTIEQMVLAVLQELYRSCERLLRPYMMRHQVGDPTSMSLFGCFQTAWRDGTPPTVHKLALLGRRALEHGLNSVKHVNPKLTFLREGDGL